MPNWVNASYRGSRVFEPGPCGFSCSSSDQLSH